MAAEEQKSQYNQCSFAAGLADHQISESVLPRPIAQVAALAGFQESEVWQYGPVKAKVLFRFNW
jgi:hypothetical protein